MSNTLSEVYASPETELREQDGHNDTSQRLAIAWIVRREHEAPTMSMGAFADFDGASRSDEDVHD